MPIRLIVGLGNPGDEYRGTRHNAGAEFVEALAARHGGRLSPTPKLLGLAGQLSNDMRLRLLIPTTFMNGSGRAVGATMKFYKLDPADVLVAHDELDFEPGVARLKDGGGHGGHNGLRDVSKAIGDGYLRLRLGIGHPGQGRDVGDYVLKRPSKSDRARIDEGIAAAIDALPPLAAGDWMAATRQLHSATDGG